MIGTVRFGPKSLPQVCLQFHKAETAMPAWFLHSSMGTSHSDAYESVVHFQLRKVHERSKRRFLTDEAIHMPHLLIQVVLRQIVWHFLSVYISIVVKFWFVVNFWFCSRSPISHYNQSRPQQGGRSRRVCRIRHKSAGIKRSDEATTLSACGCARPLQQNILESVLLPL